MSAAPKFTHGLVVTAPMSGANWFNHAGIDVHRTGEVTDDHAADRAKQVHAVKVLKRYGALNWENLQMLMAAPHETIGKGKGRRVIHRAPVAHPLLDSVVGGQG